MARAAFVGSMLGMQVQFFQLFSKLSLPWPNQFKSILYVLELTGLDPRDLFEELDWPVIDFRVLFIFVANFLPIFITILMLILFQPLHVVAWYIITVGSFILMGAGLVMHFLEEMDVGIWFTAGGALLFSICAIIGCTAYGLKKVDKNEQDDDDDEDVEEREHRRKAEALAFSLRRTFVSLVITLGLFFGGCVLTGLLIDLEFSNRENDSLRVLGYILWGLCFFSLIYFIMVVTAPGRAKLLKIGEFMNANFLMIMMLLVSISYVPCITYCLNNFMCTNYSCPAGTVFNPLANRTADSYDKSSDLFCDKCLFLDQRCSTDGNETADPYTMCPAWEDSRLWRSPDTPCNDAAAIFFTISACLVLPCYLFIIPILYIRLIGKVTHLIDNGTSLIPHNDDENVNFLPPTVQYERKVYAVEPAAASLYQPYRLQWKFSSIFFLLLSIAMVVVTSMISPFIPQNSIWILLSIHLITTIVVAVTKPFINKMEFALTIGCFGCNILNCTYAVLVMFEVGLPGEIAWVLLSINIVIPLALTIYTTKFINDSSSKAEKQKKDEKKKVEASKNKRAAPAPGGAKRRIDDDFELAVPLRDLDEDFDDPFEDPFVDNTSPLSPATVANRKRAISVSKAAAVVVPKAQKLTEYQKKQIIEKNAALAKALNFRTSAMITRYFMVIGFILLLALGASAMGYIRHVRSEFVVGSSSLHRSYDFVLGGHKSWDNFTGSCCCLKTKNPPLDYKLEERWVCENGVVVDRGRIDVDDRNGLPLRDFCSNTFNVEATVWVNSSRVDIEYTNMTEVKDVRAKARELLW